METTKTNYAIEIRYYPFEEMSQGSTEFIRDGYSTRDRARKAVDYYLRKFDKQGVPAMGHVLD